MIFRKIIFSFIGFFLGFLVKSKYNSQLKGLVVMLKEKIYAEWQKIKALDKQARREYIWDYYRAPFVGLLIILLMLALLINDIYINPPVRPVLAIAWTAEFEQQERFDALRDYLQPHIVYNPDRESVYIFSFIYTGDSEFDAAQFMRFSSMLAAGELDIVIGNFVHNEETGAMGLRMINARYLSELRPVLTEAGVSTDELLIYEEESLAFAVSIKNSPLFSDLGFGLDERYLGIMYNSRRPEAVLKAIRAIWEES